MAINKRLTEISSDEESFRLASQTYQTALDKSGYNHQLKFKHPLNTTATNTNKLNRSRNIIWYNPPYSRNVATNIGKTFLEIIDKELSLGHSLHKIFNPNAIKISYSCITNVKQIIDGHNKTKLSSTNIATEKDLCNCRRKDECPMQNGCLAESIVYQATVTTNDGEAKQTYVGLTETTFKTRYNNHKASFTNPTKQYATELSKHIWDLKNKNVGFDIKWKVLKRAKSYNSTSNSKSRSQSPRSSV